MSDNFVTIANRLISNPREELSSQTLKTYRGLLSKFDKFAPGVKCSDLSERLVIDYRQYMRDAGNSQNTISKTLSGLKTLMNRVRNEGIACPNPFIKIRVSKVHSNRKFLEIDDLNCLYKKFMDGYAALSPPQFDAMQAFLFSCFTGLRYSDLKTLTRIEIQGGKIRKRMRKTGDSVYVPLTSQAQTLIALPGHSKDGNVLHVTENTYFNRHLRAAATKLGFTKHLHCHLARHTFATTCLTIGIPLDVTSKLLGHREIQTTLIYAKYVNVLIDREMDKFKKLNAKGDNE